MIRFTWHRLTCPQCEKRSYVLLDPHERTVDCVKCERTLERRLVQLGEVSEEMERKLDEA